MTDSDNSTSLPFVTHWRGRPQAVGSSGSFDDADPVLALLQHWSRAQHVSRVLCRLQQRLERRVLDAAAPDAMDKKVGYSIACQAEVEAMTAALKIQDNLPHTQARSLLGVVAKLEIIVGADRDIDDPTDFPWPHIASALADLKEIAGSLPPERPQRSAVHAECRHYKAMAADLVGVEMQGGNLDLGQGPALGQHRPE
jgi:hypothetical protein